MNIFHTVFHTAYALYNRRFPAFPQKSTNPETIVSTILRPVSALHNDNIRKNSVFPMLSCICRSFFLMDCHNLDQYIPEDFVQISIDSRNWKPYNIYIPTNYIGLIKPSIGQEDFP